MLLYALKTLDCFNSKFSCEERESSEIYKMINSCSLWDSNPGPSAYEADAQQLMSLQLVTVHLVLPLLFLEIYLQHR